MTAAERVDLTVRSQRIHTPAGWFDGTIVVSAGKIARIAAPSEDVRGKRHIDATGRAIIPGLLDSHTHLRDPGFTDKEDFTTGTRAAAAGGVTTVLDMPNVSPPTTDADKLRAHLANAKNKSIVDFGHNTAATVPDNIAALDRAGATTFKVFMMRDVGRDYPHMPGVAIDDHATLLRICEEVAKTGKPLLVHCHDQSIYELLLQRAWDKWGRDFRSYAKAGRQYEGLNLDSGIALMLLLQKATGVRMHILHLATIGGIEMLQAAKAAGRPVSAEINPMLLFVANSWENIERLGPYALGTWIPDHHAKALWDVTIDGSADVLVATDHSPHTKAEKEIGWKDMYACPGGSPSVQHYLPLFLDAVNQGKLSLDRVVQLCSSDPAKLVNLYPRKGSITVGADADLVVVDMAKEHTISAATSFYKCGWTNLEGRRIRGMPVTTILRGTVIYDDGKILVEPGFGERVTKGE